MSNPPQPSLDERGFVHVLCNECGNPDVWLRCEQCEKSDHFVVDDAGAHCSCGADWTHATCLCGAQVPPNGAIALVRFEDGPMALADLELDRGRVAGLAVLLLLIAAGAWWALS